jgi:transcriptional regulator with XRE-family HTH domain
MRSSYYVALGARIKARREEVHIRQAELADSIGLSRTSVTNIERGRQRIFLDQFDDICRALNVSPAEIIKDIAHQNAKKPSPRRTSFKPASVQRFLASVELGEGTGE